MTLFFRLATTALTGLCALGMVGAAQAHHVQQQPYVASETRSLLQTARGLGVQVFTDKEAPGACKEGLFGAANIKSQLLICANNHGGNVQELADTVRHELVHIAQYCKAARTGASDAALLYPAHSDGFIAYAQEQLHWHILGYDTKDWGNEAEARSLAHLLNEKEVAYLLRRNCS